MGKTKIEWADRTWSPVTGCTQISPGCANCYAKRMSERFAGPRGLDPENPFAVKLHPEKLEEPLRWKTPQKIFVCSMSDLFHEDVPGKFVLDIWNRMGAAPQHTFLILTKRPERMKAFIESLHVITYNLCGPVKERFFDHQVGEFSRPYNWSPTNNIWLGVTAENQEQADKRIPILLQIPAVKRFVSVEPMLGPVDLRRLGKEKSYSIDALNGLMESNEPISVNPEQVYQTNKLDWVICGGESGPGARPMHPDWARWLRNQCNDFGTPFMFKQWGEWAPFYDRDKDDPEWENVPQESKQFCRINLAGGHGFHGDRIVYTQRVGKKASGRLLDGVLWDQYPDGTDIDVGSK